ncbi:aldehyde dehydrogenase 3 family member [Ramicandelaber brevisporus]|nr:aldehyde dehydrogenase 3 family member [Ramicandelaber brevisporus]
MSAEATTTAAPFTGESLYTPVADIASVVTSLRKAYSTGSTRPIAERKKHLQRLHDGLKALEDKLAQAIYDDMRRSPFQNKMLEVWPSQQECKEYIDNIDAWAKPEKVTDAGITFVMDKLEIRHEPQGVVLIVGPWNYPIRLLILPLIGAIAGGNVVIIKPSEVAPHTMAVLTELVTKYLDPNVVRVVNGGVEQSTELLTHRFDHVFYTGAGTIGKIYMSSCAKHLTPVTLELGGKSPVIVDSDHEDIERAAERIAFGKYLNVGQTCIAPDYVLVLRSVHDKFVEYVSKAITKAYGENPKESKDYSRIISARHFHRLRNLLLANQKSNPDIKLLTGSNKPLSVDADFDEADLYIPPTIVTGVGKHDELMADELFGPYLPIIPVDSIEEAVEYVNSKEYPLALYAFSSNRAHADYILNNTRSGDALVNDVTMHIVCNKLPFGGFGPSGIGAYQGKHSFHTFTHKRSVMIRNATGPYKLDAVRFMPLSGEANEWKQDAVLTLLYPPAESERNFLSRMVRKIPGVPTLVNLVYVIKLLLIS